MKTVFINGKFYVEKGVYAQAVLVEDGIFAKVGTEEEVRAAAGDAEVVDCGGKTVIPGLNDSHCHLLGVAQGRSYVPIMGSNSIEEVIRRGQEFLKKHPNAKGLKAMGWNVVDFVEGEQRNLLRQDLDKISTEIPIGFTRACGHMAVYNTKALELAGVDENTAQVEGGVFETEENGYPNGRFSEKAKELVSHMVPEPSIEQVVDSFYEVMEYANAHGLTSVQTNDPGQVNSHAEVFAALHALHDAGKLTVRYHTQSNFATPAEFEAYMEGEAKDPRYDDVLSRGPLKIFKDGSIGSRSALLREPYLDDPQNKGVIVVDDEPLAAFFKAADKYGVQVLCHCIGDGAIENVLGHIEAVMHDGKNPLRHGIVHCQIMDQEMMERLKKDEVLVLAQPIFLHSDMHALPTRIPEELARTSNAYRTLMEMGIPQSFGTDSPVEDCNPFPCIYCAVTRKDLRGFPEGGYFPEECITVEEAVDCYTIGSAYAQFMEDRKGRIKEGYLADMAVLDTDIFTCDPMQIKDTKSVLTVMGGKIVYKA